MNIDRVRRYLELKLDGHLDEHELTAKATTAAEILAWKDRRNAVILAHNYMEPALYHTVADFRGDSLELSRRAARVDADVIVFCGVRFMAETAKILKPECKVLVPAEPAGCSLAAGITAEDVRALKARFPGVPVVAYVNSYAEVKAEADVCCTSGNAVAVVEALDADTIIFLPDEYLARNVARSTGKRMVFPRQAFEDDRSRPERLIGWTGRCEVHERFTTVQIDEARRRHPDVEVLAHLECRPEVVATADYSGGTAGMIRRIRESDARRFLLLTDCAMGANLAAQFPGREFLDLPRNRCPHMAEVTLENTLEALSRQRFEVTVPEAIRIPAARAIERMLTLH